MNCLFPFPRQFAGDILKLYFKEAGLDPEFSAESMAWKIDALLPELVDEKGFETVRAYLGGGELGARGSVRARGSFEKNTGSDGASRSQDLKRFQLAQKIAHLFDQYLLYRPEMIMDWQRGKPVRPEELWQARLWRELVGESQPLHLAAISEALEGRMEEKVSGIPERVSLFGMSTIAPLYLRVFFGLARHCEVNIFELNPSQEYYGEDLSPRHLSWLARKHTPAELKRMGRIAGNPLLTSLGKLNRDSTELRLELDERAGSITQEADGGFVAPEGESLLAKLQEDLLYARACESGREKFPVAEGDRSIQIHSCHSPMREMEVLYDLLLDLFDNDPSLKPGDILVMAPDLEKYAPFIQAVFEFPEEESRRIPFSLADRVPSTSNPAIETFLALLAVPTGRFTASEVVGLLERAPIRERFGFTIEELDRIRKWVMDLNIAWGIDAEFRSKLELPPVESNTWHAGLQRLLLGFAMPGHNHHLFEGILPYDEIEGGAAELLGRFLSAVEALMELSRAVQQDPDKVQPLSEWVAWLENILAQFFSPDREDLSPIHFALDRLRKPEGRGACKAGFRVVRYFLAQILDEVEQRGGFLAGCVTFCALQPMRSIPARVIALVGLGDEGFPRNAQAPGFDLMAAKPKCGDRSPREDDRYTFLEALVSARDRLLLSYVGRSITNNTVIPPSVLVSELLDYLGQIAVFPGGKEPRDFLVADHQLHPFSRSYFDGSAPGLFSYSEANAKAARSNGVGLLTSAITGVDASSGNASESALSGAEKDLRLLTSASGGASQIASGAGFFDQPVPPPDEEFREVALGNLIAFFANPARYFLRERLGIRFEEEEEAFADLEPFGLDALQAYAIKQELIEAGLSGQPYEPEHVSARGLLPPGQIGRATFKQAKNDADRVLKAVWEQIAGLSRSEPRPLDFAAGEFRLTGEIGGLYGSRLVQYRCARLKPRDFLGAWIKHLSLCATASAAGGLCESAEAGLSPAMTPSPGGLSEAIYRAQWETVLLGREESCRFGPIENAPQLLAELLEIYWQGLHAPIPFFPQSALACVREASLEAAWKAWNGGYNSDGEKADPYFEFCFGSRNPIDAEFERLARLVFGPVVAAMGALGGEEQ
jgi:exodeoxyribonuclease V gamma subunit